jgi:serine phosphatase RsbU (regulator of sigma subunit)
MSYKYHGDMIGIFQSIRAKLLFSFFIFLFIAANVVVVDFWFNARKAKIQKVTDTFQTINLNLQRSEKLEYVFFKDEVINTDFYETGKSQVLAQRKQLIEITKKELKNLKQNAIVRPLEVVKNIDQLILKFDEYEKEFEHLVRLIYRRGFKGYGVEGKMREAIHKIESSNTAYDKVKMLMMRRHEKDFIIRKQMQYIDELHDMANLLRKEMVNNVELTQFLEEYENAFDELANLEKAIGFTDKDGLKRELSTISQAIGHQIDSINLKVQQRASSLKTQNDIIQISALLVSILLIIFVGFYISKILSQPIRQLSASIHQVVETNFSEDVAYKPIQTKDEVGLLSKDVAYMVGKVQTSMSEIRQQTEKVERKHKILMEGVNYAKKIQQAILPDFALEQHFKKFFVLFKPQYDVSGDFYWFSEVDNRSYIAVVDCTGKGVSGAFMSMISNTLLSEIINEKRIIDPELILETLNIEFGMALHQDHNMGHDSLEICLCRIEPHPEKENYTQVTFAGANRSIFYSQGWDILELKGTSRSIGGKHYNKNITFESHTIELKKGDFLYLTTDGFINQQNADKEKYGTQHFKDFLRKIIHLPVKEQEQALHEELDVFLQGNPLRDDVTVFVLKL